jgi:UDP-N-acetylglucosamine 2-epimerase (non-hydrolysing)
MHPKKVLLCMGTRPEIIKMAPVVRALEERQIEALVFHTGQHREVAEPLYRLFGIVPAVSVDHLDRKGGSLAELGAALLEASHAAIARVKPDIVLVHGDTSSALMAALAAFYHEVSIGHVEAGLRTGDIYDPFPEEMNRRLIARMARWHFAPTRGARAELSVEGIEASAIHMVGNTAVDAALDVARRARTEAGLVDWPPALRDLRDPDNGRRLVLVTAHRRENWGAGIAGIIQAVAALVEGNPGIMVVWPVHPNPQVRDAVHNGLAATLARHPRRLRLVEPLDYACLVTLLERSWLVLTDSGGIQEEAAAFGTPVLVLRETTERPELIAAGGGIVVGTDPQRIIAAAAPLLRTPDLRAALVLHRNPFGDGNAAERIARILDSSNVQEPGHTMMAELEDY